MYRLYVCVVSMYVNDFGLVNSVSQVGGTAATKQAVQLCSVGESEQRGDRAASQEKRLPASQRQGEF
jgi:hypothetical protein